MVEEDHMLKDFFTGVRGSDNKDDFALVVQPILDENVSFFINYVNPCCWISCQVKKKKKKLCRVCVLVFNKKLFDRRIDT